MKKVKHILLTSFLLMLAILGCKDDSLLFEEEEKWLQENNDITVAIYPYYTPYQFTNKRKVTQGVFIDYLRLLEKKIDYTFKKKQYDNWPLVLEDAKNNTIDIILEAQKTDERSEYLTFNDILFESEFVIVTHEDASFGKNIESLYGKTLVLPSGYSVEDILNEHTANIKFYNKNNDAECLKSVNAGEYDAFIGPKAVVNYIINTNKLDNLKIAGNIEDTYHPSLAVRKNNLMLSSIISKATKSITRAEKERLIKNWLYDIEKPFYGKVWFWIYTTLILGLLIGLGMYFNRYLKKQIRYKKLELQASQKALNEDTALKINFIEKASKSYKKPLEIISNNAERLLSSKDKPTEVLLNNMVSNADILIKNTDNYLQIQSINTTTNNILNDPLSKIKKTSLNILIVDDVLINRMILEKLLSKVKAFKFNIIKAENGKVAVDYCKNNSDIDIVFMDIRMPVMDGYEASQKIKELNPDLPIIAQTAYVSVLDKIKAEEAGCSGYITKPLSIEKLRKEISRFYEPIE